MDPFKKQKDPWGFDELIVEKDDDLFYLSLIHI